MSDHLRKSISVTLDEIVDHEREFKEKHGIDIRDEDEWQTLGDIVARIEAKLLANEPAE